MTLFIALVGTGGCQGEVDAVPAIGFGANPSAAPSLAVARDIHDMDAASVRFDVVPDDTVTERTEAAVSRAQDIVDIPGIALAIGHARSRGTLAAAREYRDRGIPLLSPVATSDDLDTAGDGIYRLVPGNRAQGAFLAGYAADSLAAQSATIFFVADEYGSSLSESIVDAFTGRGGSILDRVPVVEDADLNMRLLVGQALRRGRPDVLLLAVRAAEAAEIITLVHELAGSLPILSGDGGDDEAAIQAGVPLEAWMNFYRVRFWHESLSAPRSNEFLARFRSIHDREPTDGDAMHFQAVDLALTALGEGAETPADVRAFLESLGRDRDPFPGVTGPVDFVRGPSGALLLVHSASDHVVARYAGGVP